MGLDLSEDEPWWATGVRTWIAMAQAIRQAPGRTAAGWRALFERKLERDPPDFLYRFYAEWLNALEREGRRD